MGTVQLHGAFKYQNALHSTHTLHTRTFLEGSCCYYSFRALLGQYGCASGLCSFVAYLFSCCQVEIAWLDKG